jgi:hypothetical protein
MKKIYKYDISGDYLQEILMPKGAQILTAQVQAGIPRIWALIDTDQPTEKRKFILMGTGQGIPDEITANIKYIDTFQECNGEFVWHLFEVIEQ